MTISSILSGLPVFKTLQNNQAKATTDVAQTEKAVTQDVVEISSEVAQRLEQEAGAQALSFDDIDSVRNFAQETADLVAATDYSLGLDPEFDADA